MPSPHNADVVALFPALSLADAGHPHPAVHSDLAFALLFGAPSPGHIEPEPGSTGQRFPAALMTDVGMLGLAHLWHLVDVPDSMRAPLRDVKSTVWRAMEVAREVGHNQVWSWTRADGCDVLHSFGPLSSTAADGSDAA